MTQFDATMGSPLPTAYYEQDGKYYLQTVGLAGSAGAPTTAIAMAQYNLPYDPNTGITINDIFDGDEVGATSALITTYALPVSVSYTAGSPATESFGHLLQEGDQLRITGGANVAALTFAASDLAGGPPTITITLEA